MRALCLIFVLANLAFAGWAQLIDRPLEVAVPTALPPTAQRLMLATEAQRQQPSPEKRSAATASGGDRVPAGAASDSSSLATPAVAATTATPPSCTSVGPFKDLSEATRASAALRGAGFESQQRLEQGEFWMGYWISLPGFAKRADAERVLAQLKEHHVSDAYVIPGAAGDNVVSLGVFADMARAQHRLEEITAYGFTPQLVDRKRSGTVYWVDVDLAQAGKILDPSIVQAEPGKIVRLEVQPCPAAAGKPDK
jgi:hypothetical protein